jgi:3-phenylpropionate/trans-cinnamate dioxygenase ferredoxin reductase component
MRIERRIVVVGASAAGLTTVEALRSGGYADRLTLVGVELRLPYKRPPLSKQTLSGVWAPERALLTSAKRVDELDVDLRLGVRADAVDLGRRKVSLSGGDELPYDALVIATGVTPRRLPSGHELAGVHVLRTLDDSLAFREDLIRGGPLVILGAGPLGCEVAATARQLGLDVTLVDVLPVPMLQQVGREIGALLADLHIARGVELRLGMSITRLRGAGGRVVSVELADGSALKAQTVLVSIGSVPACGWLRGSGLPLGDGIVCDEFCRAYDRVYAAGDVAEWFNPRFSMRMRVEHRVNAEEQARAVAANILGRRTPYAPIPHFSTDQYHVKLRAHGILPADARMEFEREEGDQSRFAAIYSRDGVVRGVLGWNISCELRQYRGWIGKRVALAG